MKSIIKKDLSQVNPQLYESLAIFNERTAAVKLPPTIYIKKEGDVKRFYVKRKTHAAIDKIR